MKPYSTDFRLSVVRAYEGGQGSQRQLAQLFGVSLGFVQNLLQRYRHSGSVEPKPHSGGNPGKIRGHLEVVRELQQQEPDATLAEMCERVAAVLKVEVSATTISRGLQRLKLPRKKNVSRRRTRPAGGPARTSGVPGDHGATKDRGVDLCG